MRAFRPVGSGQPQRFRRSGGRITSGFLHYQPLRLDPLPERHDGLQMIEAPSGAAGPSGRAPRTTSGESVSICT